MELGMIKESDVKPLPSRFVQLLSGLILLAQLTPGGSLTLVDQW